MRRALISILGSNALSQLLIVASTPLLTRTYSQADFGWFGVATTLALVSSTLLTLRLEHAIHVSDLGPARLHGICLSLILLSALALGAPVVLATLVLAGIEASARIDVGLILLFALTHALLVVSMFLLNYQQRFRLIALTNLLVPAAFVSGALIGPTLPGHPNALLFWQASAHGIGALLLLVCLRRTIIWPSLTDIQMALRRERACWQFLVPSQLFSILSLNLSVIGTAWQFDPAVAGLVVIAQRIARAPVTVIGNGLNEVLRAAIPTRHLLLRTFCVVALLCLSTGVVMVVAVYLVPDTTYGWLLGGNWNGLRAVLVITVIGALFQLIGTSVISMLTSFAKRSDLIINSSLLIAGAVALTVAASLDTSATTYLWLHVVLSSGVYLTGFWLAWGMAREHTTA